MSRFRAASARSTSARDAPQALVPEPVHGVDRGGVPVSPGGAGAVGGVRSAWCVVLSGERCGYGYVGGHSVCALAIRLETSRR